MCLKDPLGLPRSPRAEWEVSRRPPAKMSQSGPPDLRMTRLPRRVLRARLDRDRDGLLVFFVGVVLFCVAAAVYFLAHLLVAAAPVVVLASGTTISEFASNASRRVVGQWRGAGGASCEDHLAFCGELCLRGG